MQLHISWKKYGKAGEIAMASKDKKTNKNRCPLELDDKNYEQLKLLKKYSKYATTFKAVLVKALEEHFDQELSNKNNHQLKMEWERFTREKKTKIVPLRKD